MESSRSENKAHDLVTGASCTSLTGSAAGTAGARAGGAGGQGDDARASGVPLTQIERWRLPRLVPVYESQLDDVPHMIGVLTRALAGERRRGRDGHWAYVRLREESLRKYLSKYEEANMRRLSHGEECHIAQLGLTAEESGVPASACPYAHDDPRHAAWMAGWEQGRARRTKQRQIADEALAKWRGQKCES